MRRAIAAFPLILALGANAAPAGERCLAAHYQLPQIIGGELRSYLICGLLRGRDSHFTVSLNGLPVSVSGSGADSCDRIRQTASRGAEAQLVAFMPDPNARLTFVAAELDKIDRYLAVAERSEDLGVDEEPAAPPCRTANAQN